MTPPSPARVGRYEIQRPLGEGPLGRVLLARDPSLGRTVAIKVLRDGPGPASAPLGEALRQSASASAGLSHPAVVAVHDVGEDPEAGPFVVLEFVSGPTLRERLARGRLSRAEVARLARGLGEAVGFAHASGTLHGNLKPENVFLTPAGPKIADFGSRGSAPPYGAPEVFASGVPSARGDEFSLAATLYEALTGALPFAVPPFEGAPDDGDAAREARRETASARRPAPVSSIAPDVTGARHLDAVFECALAADPGRRFPTCESFAVTLAQTLEESGAPLLTPPFSQSSLVPRATRRWQNAVAAAAALIILALLALGRRTGPEGVSLKSVARDFAATLRVPVRTFGAEPP